MTRKLLATLLAAVLLTAVSMMPSLAQTFPDVTEDSYGWALEAVEEMVEDGIIKGYTDNTFKPERTITKIEALVLGARILGYTNENYAEFTELAKTLYEEVLSGLETAYPGEIAFLLYKNVLTEKELPYYIGGDNASAGMRRYEVAKLLTKLMDGEKDIDESATVSDYRDQSEIPADAKPYVRFVTDAGLMNGVPCPDTGVNFNPLGTVTRAQIATLLYRIKNLLAQSYTLGTIKAIDTKNEAILYIDANGEENKVTIPFDADPMIKKDGFSVEFEKLTAGSVLLLCMRNEFLHSIDTISRMPDEVFEGVISSVTTMQNKTELRVYRLSDESEIFTYPVSENASVKYEGGLTSASSLKRSQFVKLEIKGGEVVSIEATASERSIVGTLEEITLEPSLSFSIRLANGDVEKYPVSSAATAKRNGSKTEIGDILVGDKISVVLRYEEVFSVTATSSKFITKGTIEEIVIATLPSLKIRENNVVNTYSLSRDCAYTVDGSDGSIYDLRLGANVTVSVDSETIVSLTATAPASTAATIGVIESINSAYGFFTMTVEGTDQKVTTMQVFTKRSNLKVIDSTTGATKRVSDLKNGMTVSVTGVTATGAYEATTIIIMPSES